MQYYTPTTWVNGTTKLNATNMNHIESYLKYLSDLLQDGDIPTNLKNGTGHGSLQQGDSQATEWYAIAFNSSQALGSRSFTTGGGTKATSNMAFAEGEFTWAAAWASHAMGHNTVTAAAFQLVCGKNNVGRDNTFFEVGNGYSEYTEVLPKPTYTEAINGRYYARNAQGGHNLITSINMTPYQYMDLEHVYEDTGPRSNAFEVFADGSAKIGLMGNDNLSIATKEYVDSKQSAIPTIAITQSMITGYGTGGAPYGNPWYRFNFGANNQYLIDDKYDTIRLDITAIKALLGIPTDYLFIKRNVTNSNQGITLYQFFIADSGFDYSHITDPVDPQSPSTTGPYIQIAQIGDAALIYEPTTGAGFLTNRNINPTDIYRRFSDMFDDYSASSTYAVGDYVWHDGALWKCTTAISTAEAWNSAHWTLTQVGIELKSKLDKVGPSPEYTPSETYVLDFINNHSGIQEGKIIILNLSGLFKRLFGRFVFTGGNTYGFEFEEVGGNIVGKSKNRYVGTIDLTNKTFGDLFNATTYRQDYVVEGQTTTLYRHHFDIYITSNDLPTLPSGAEVAININALSNSETPWETLSELDGGGFIVSAFGTIVVPQVSTSYVFELKIFYASLNTLLLNVHDLTDNSVKAIAITTVDGGTTPSAYQIQDSVTKL